MTSNINYAAINENFPVAGQDNDTQVFRDNFDTIKTNFQEAKTEIEDLQDNAARTDQDNDCNGFLIYNAKTQNIKEVMIPAETEITALELPIEFEAAAYQVYTLANNVTCTLTQFPSDSTTVGKVTLELYSYEDATRTVTFSLSGTGASNKKKNGFPTVVGGHDLEVSSSTNPVIVEIWRHGVDNFYFKYVGQFA